MFTLGCQLLKKKKEKDKQPAKPRLSVRWRTGGECGGSCWDDGTEDRHRPVDADDEPEFAELDRIFEALYPDISYLKYKSFARIMFIQA